MSLKTWDEIILVHRAARLPVYADMFCSSAEYVLSIFGSGPQLCP
jgi:hypothetical protein